MMRSRFNGYEDESIENCNKRSADRKTQCVKVMDLLGLIARVRLNSKDSKSEKRPNAITSLNLPYYLILRS